MPEMGRPHGICSSDSCCTYRTCSQPAEAIKGTLPALGTPWAWTLLIPITSSCSLEAPEASPAGRTGWGSSILWDTARSPSLLQDKEGQHSILWNGGGTDLLFHEL